MIKHILNAMPILMLLCSCTAAPDTGNNTCYTEDARNYTKHGHYGDPYGEPRKPTEYTEHTLYADEDVVVRASIIKLDGSLIVHQEGENLTTLTIERDGKEPVTLPHDGLRLNTAPKVIKNEQGLFVITFHSVPSVNSADGDINWKVEVTSKVYLLKWTEDEPVNVFSDRHTGMDLTQPEVSYIQYEFVDSWSHPLQLLLLKYTTSLGKGYLTPYKVECLKTYAYIDSAWVKVEAREDESPQAEPVVPGE